MSSIEIVNGLANERADILYRRSEILKAVQQAIKAASFAVERRVKYEMPVDTGRARASWGHWTPGDIRANPDASPGDAVWREAGGGLSITQGTNVEYVQYLNDGHSRQAPAGFLDRAEEKGIEVLDERVTALMDLF